MRNQILFYIAMSVALFLQAGCAADDDRAEEDEDAGSSGVNGDGGITSCADAPGEIYCDGEKAVVCDSAGKEESRIDCTVMQKVCVDGLGCRDCHPGDKWCDGTVAMACTEEGEEEIVKDCSAEEGETCSEGVCMSACDAESDSYLGCSYFSTVTSNALLNITYDYHFSIVVGNGNTSSVTIRIEGNGTSLEETVPPGVASTINLPWNTTLKDSAGSSTRSPDGAYSIKSTMPVTVYQFNPLEYSVTAPDNTEQFSWTNDASLLYPIKALDTEYVVVSWPRERHARCGWPTVNDCPDADFSDFPGTFTVVGTENGTELSITFTAFTSGLDDDETYSPGTKKTFSIDEGEVIQFATAATSDDCAEFDEEKSGTGITTDLYEYCLSGRQWDLSGTIVKSSRRVAVFAGADCTNVPYNRVACDHLEEQILPLKAWGTDYVVSKIDGERADYPNLVRIIGGTDGTKLEFEPSSIHDSATLDTGDILMFETTQSFRVHTRTSSGRPTGKIFVAQYMVAQNYCGKDADDAPQSGDPAFVTVVPVEQFRKSYIFLTPETFVHDYVNIITKKGTSIMLDGSPVSGFSAVGQTGYVDVQIEINHGQHSIESQDGTFGIIVSAIAPYTSYMYPGGLDLKEIILE